VTAITQRRPALAAVSLSLLLSSLALLLAGHFVSWNDVNGVQSDRWNYGYGTVSALCASLGTLVSLFDRVARRLAGGAVAAFVVFLVVARVTGSYFSFVGSTDAFGLNTWTVLLGMAAFVLLTPRWTRAGEWWERRPGRRRLTAWGRWSMYVLLLIPVAYLCLAAAAAVLSHVDPCRPRFEDCELAGLAALYYGFFAWVGVLIVVVLAELVAAVLRWSRRRRASRVRTSY
jgi:hypothetical protein